MIRAEKCPILYVDDTLEQRYAMRRILEKNGFGVIEASTAKEGLALLAGRPALAVVDVKLPDMSGYELTRRIKEHDPNLPVLQVSASFSDPDLRAAGFSGGADAYIAQPVHPPELVALIRRMLRLSEAEERLRFLATLGPRLSATLSLPELIRDVQNLVVPYFADECFIYVQNQAKLFYGPAGVQIDQALQNALREQALESSVKKIGSRLLIAPLSVTASGFGAIAFQLRTGREYAEADSVLALDLANRFGLAFHNCVLFASEQAAKAALIQAEKLATAGRMSAAIAHEINNPLEALTNLMYILEQSTDATDTIRNLAGAALSEITRLAHITRQTLGFYKELRASSNVNLSQCVRDTVNLYQKRIKAERIQLDLDLTEKACIQAIPGEIRQVVSNLLVNALEAVENRGRIRIVTSYENDRARLCVQDSGNGISETLENRIFEPFFTTKQGTGIGLGLWITKTIIEKHGGTITAQNLEGKNAHGAEFLIEFPLVIPDCPTD